ncbi:MAG: poly-gamma-glutamate hydrolase family protein [Bacteroidota bacterium]
MTRGDRYPSFASLAECASVGVDYRILVRKRHTPIAVVAPHGGGIEPGTSELAEAIAGRTLSLYCFIGLKNARNDVLHITSTRFDEPRSQQLIASAEVVVAIHACGVKDSGIFVGGLHGELKAAIIEALSGGGFNAVDDNTHHGGRDPRNICNRGLAGGGVQLELSTGLRRRMFQGLSRKGRTTTTATFSEFTATMQKVLFRSL